MNKKIVVLLLFFSPSIYAQNLLDIYQLALQNDPILRQSLANKMRVGEAKDQSIARLLPMISANASTGYNWSYQKSFFNRAFSGQGEVAAQGRSLTRRNDYWESQMSLNLVQPIFHWDMWVQLSQSEKQIAKANASYLAEQQNLLLKTINAYFGVLAAQDNLTFTLAENKAIAKQLDQAQQKFDVGLIAITDVYEAQAGYDQSLSDSISVENLLEDAKEALREIIGDYSSQLSLLGEELPLLEPIPNDIQAWNSQALKQNLQILVAQHAAEISEENIGLQRSGHYPQLDIIGNMGLNDNNSNSFSRGNSERIGLQLNVPLFQGGAVNSRVRQAKYGYTQAKENLLATQRAVTREVKDSYRGVIASISRVTALKSAVISGKSALEANQSGFDVGTRTMIDVLSATRNYTSAQSKYAKARYAYVINGIRLKNAASILSITDLEAINRYLK